jgi:hypothetical protein
VIVYDSNHDGGQAIYVADADGGQPRKLVEGFEPLVAGGYPALMYVPRPLPRPTATPAPTVVPAMPEAPGE